MHIVKRSHRYLSGKHSSGFSLIELMVAVAIVAILASVAYPSYQTHIIKSNRGAAKGYMLTLAGRQEQLMLDRRQYLSAANNAALNSTLGLIGPANEVSRFYNVSVVADNAATPPTFVITAVPNPSSVQSSDPTLTLNSRGEKNPPGYW